MLPGKRVAQLVDLDLEKALKLLVRHVDVLPPSLVVPGLQVGGGRRGALCSWQWRRGTQKVTRGN